MPTQKFINLTESKKQTILTAMCREFMNIPYSEIRISNLIQKAGISRASFYLYFEDKEDLLGCIAESWVDVILRKLTEAFRVSDGSYYESMKLWMSQALENDISREVWKVYKRVMASAMRQISARPVRRKLYHSHILEASSVLSHAKPPMS